MLSRGAPKRVPNQRGNAREASRPQGHSVCLPAGGSPPSRRPGRRSWTATFSFAAPGLSCALSVFHLACGMLDVSVAACGIYFSDQGLNPGPLHWECGVSASGLPEVLETLSSVCHSRMLLCTEEILFPPTSLLLSCSPSSL